MLNEGELLSVYHTSFSRRKCALNEFGWSEIEKIYESAFQMTYCDQTNAI